MRCGKVCAASKSAAIHGSQPARMRCGKADILLRARQEVSRRNPHECAVAKSPKSSYVGLLAKSQPARMRCGKACYGNYNKQAEMSQPARMRCGKERCDPPAGSRSAASQPARMRCGKEVWRLEYAVKIIVATRTNALRQSQYRHGSLTASPSRNPRECAEAKCSMPASALMPSLRVPLFTTLNNPCPQVR